MKKPNGFAHNMSERSERALVTGASSGIGREIARILASQGAELIICARRQTELEELATELNEKHGTESQIIISDLSTEEGVNQLIKEAGEVDILVNNAGFGTSGKHTKVDIDRQLQMIDLNIRGLTQLSHAYAKKMKRGNRILNVASVAGFIPIPSMAVYAATKAYVLSFSRSLHAELKKDGIIVTALCPGYVPSGFQEVAGIDQSRIGSFGSTSAEATARSAVRAMRKNRREVVAGWINKPFPLILRTAPIRMQLFVSKLLMESN